MAVTTYQAALDFLYRYIPVPTHRADPAENLARTRELLDALGTPDARLRSVVVAGTKGKGSTSAMSTPGSLPKAKRLRSSGVRS
ncbi:MAG: hypothetical protein EBS29_12865 [Chloroflexia bacterium]|nr:hypothetical protein [Chloroflexia bacterium]